MFAGIFVLSFAFGSLPKGGVSFSGPWLRKWAWAAVPRLAVAATASLVVLAVLTVGSGDDTNGVTVVSCDTGIPALSNNPVSAGRMKEAIDFTRGTALAAGTGDINAAREHFFGPAHDLTHDIDPPLRRANAQLATTLCRSVIMLENHLLGVPPVGAPQIADEAQQTAELLRQAANALGFSI